MNITEDRENAIIAQFLAFNLNNEYYGIPLLKVNEIIGYNLEVTQVPQTPRFIKGIINLRGKIIPVMDLRTKLNMAERSVDNETCIIIVEKNQFSLTGIIVDKVAEVISFATENIEAPPDYGEDSNNGYLTGIGKKKDSVVLLLNVDKILDYKMKNIAE